MIHKIVLASNNAGKLAELQAMLAPLGFGLLRQSELGIGEAPEPYRTFVENALVKARHAAAASGLPVVFPVSGVRAANMAQFLNYLLLPFRANRGQQDPKRLLPIILL